MVHLLAHLLARGWDALTQSRAEMAQSSTETARGYVRTLVLTCTQHQRQHHHLSVRPAQRHQ